MLRTLSLIALLGMPSLSAFAAPEGPKPDPKTEQPRVKVFRLKIVEPNDALQAFNALFGLNAPRAAEYIPPVAPPGIPPPPPANLPLAPPPNPNIRFEVQVGDPLLQQPMPTPIRPPSSMMPVMAAPAAPPIVCRAIADPRTRSLIVRGMPKDLQLAADLVAVLDTPDTKPLPAVKSLKAFRLEHLDADDLVGILAALDPSISYRMVPIGRMKLLLATGSDEHMKELTDAVKELDIAAK